MRSRIRWVLVVWMFVISAIAYLDRVNISIAGKAIQEEFRLTQVELGWVFSAFVIGYALFQAPGGRLADWMGPRRVLTLGVVWWGIFTSLSASVPASLGIALAALIGIRFVLGMGEAVVYPASNCLVAKWLPSSERGVANGLIFAGVGAGAGITPPLITWILLHHGWRWSFFISAALGLAAGAVWYAIARDDPRQHPWVNAAEVKHIESGLPISTIKGPAVPWSAILRSREVLALSASYFAYGYTAYIFFTWFFRYLTDARQMGTNISSAYYSMLPFIAMALCSPLGGWISDRVTRRHGKRAGRCGIAVVGIGLAAVFVALATQVASAHLAIFVLAGGAGALYLSQSSFWSVTADIAGRSAGTVSGFMNMCGQMGGALTASLTPYIAVHFGWTASFLVAAALCAVGSVLWLAVDPERELAH